MEGRGLGPRTVTRRGALQGDTGARLRGCHSASSGRGSFLAGRVSRAGLEPWEAASGKYVRPPSTQVLHNTLGGKHKAGLLAGKQLEDRVGWLPAKANAPFRRYNTRDVYWLSATGEGKTRFYLMQFLNVFLLL